jgi:hypothetical protein
VAAGVGAGPTVRVLVLVGWGVAELCPVGPVVGVAPRVGVGLLVVLLLAAQVAEPMSITSAVLPEPAVSVTRMPITVVLPSVLVVVMSCATVAFLPTGPAGVPVTVAVVCPWSQDTVMLLAVTRPARAVNPWTVAAALPPPADTVAELMLTVPSLEAAAPLAVRVVPSVDDTAGVAEIGDAPEAVMP